MKYNNQLNKLCALLGVVLFLEFIPCAVFAHFNITINLDIVTNYPGVSYYAARSALKSTLAGQGARWGFLGVIPSTNITGTTLVSYPDGYYVLTYTTQTNYYLPVQEKIVGLTDTNFTYYYMPFSNTLSITVSGPVTPVEWILSGPAEFANSTAYRTSGSNSMNLVAIPTGTYSVTLPTVRGYATPTATSTNITGASPLVNVLNLNYIPYSNSLAVTVSGITSGSNCVWTLAGPAEFANAISFGTVFTNTFTVSGIPTGLYTVTFPAMSGYTTPSAVSTNIIGTSPLVNNMTGSYVSVIWPSATNPPAPPPTNFPVFTNAITLMVDSNGLFKTPSREKIIAANGLLTNGAVGPAGPTGATGPQGIPGSNGVDGVTGPQGPAGSNGVAGATGPTGSNGVAGATGPQGPVGSNGVVGAQGPQGIQGPAGSNGIAGATGPQGPSGTNGAVGPQGIPGPAGTNGVDGAQGPQGIYRGQRGLMGQRGHKARQAQTVLTVPRVPKDRQDLMAWTERRGRRAFRVPQVQTVWTAPKAQQERMALLAHRARQEQMGLMARRGQRGRTVRMEQLVLKVHRVQPVPMAWMERKVRQERTVLTAHRGHKVRLEQTALTEQLVRRGHPEQTA